MYRPCFNAGFLIVNHTAHVGFFFILVPVRQKICVMREELLNIFALALDFFAPMY